MILNVLTGSARGIVTEVFGLRTRRYLGEFQSIGNCAQHKNAALSIRYFAVEKTQKTFSSSHQFRYPLPNLHLQKSRNKLRRNPDEIAYGLLASLAHSRLPGQSGDFCEVLGWRCIGIRGVGTEIPKKRDDSARPGRHAHLCATQKMSILWPAAGAASSAPQLVRLPRQQDQSLRSRLHAVHLVPETRKILDR